MACAIRLGRLSDLQRVGSVVISPCPMTAPKPMVVAPMLPDPYDTLTYPHVRLFRPVCRASDLPESREERKPWRFLSDTATPDKTEHKFCSDTTSREIQVQVRDEVKLDIFSLQMLLLSTLVSHGSSPHESSTNIDPCPDMRTFSWHLNAQCFRCGKSATTLIDRVPCRVKVSLIFASLSIRPFPA